MKARVRIDSRERTARKVRRARSRQRCTSAPSLTFRIAPEYPEGHKRAPPDSAACWKHSLKNPAFNGIGAAGAAGNRSCAAGPSLAASQAAFHLRHTRFDPKTRSVMTHFLAFSIRYLRASFVVAPSILVVLGFASPSESQVRTGRDGIRRARQPISGRYLVVLRGHRKIRRLRQRFFQAMGRGRVRHVYRNAVRGFTVETSEAGARALAGDPGVAMVEEDGLVYTAGWQTLDGGDSWGLGLCGSATNRRLISGRLYHGLYRYSGDGNGVNVYVVDTGIRHLRTSNSVDVRCRHLTRLVMATAALIVTATELTLPERSAARVTAWPRLSTLHPLGLLGCVAADGRGLGACAWLIDWITANYVKLAVIKGISVGGGQSETVNAAIRSAIAQGITFVGAAGNDGEDSCLHLMVVLYRKRWWSEPPATTIGVKR